MKKVKQILAISCAVFLLLLYVITFIAGITTSPAQPGLFKACIYSTFVLPVFIYAYLLIYRLLKNDKEEQMARLKQTQDEDMKHDIQ